jgi:hypothetical protein
VSYHQAFQGRYTFADEHCLEAAIDRFAAHREESIVRIDVLRVAGAELELDYECSAPASRFDTTLVALADLAEHALSGVITCTFHLDGVSYDRIAAGGRTDASDLPPRHYRWDVYFAAKTGNAARLRALAAMGVSLDQQYDDGSTLYLAAQTGELAAVTLLIDAGVPVGSALVAATTGDIARALIAAGADVNARLGSESPLARVVYYKREAVELAILEAGARPPPEEYEKIVERCAGRGSLATLLELAKRFPAITAAFAREKAMQRAIEGGEPVVVDLFLQHGAQLPADYLQQAVRHGALALVEQAMRAPDALAKCGPSSNREDAMCVAAYQANVELLALLARHGVPVHPREPGDTSPLHQAVGSYRKTAHACVMWLLDNGAPAHAPKAGGWTPFRAALDAFNGELAVLLAERGADASELNDLVADERAHVLEQVGEPWAAKLVELAGK